MMVAPTMEYAPRGELRFDEPMSRHTSWRVGGPADQLFIPADRDDLVGFMRNLEAGTKVTWIGLGSNLLVRDAGIRGVVIATHKGFNRIELIGARRLYVESGVAGAKVARFSVRNHLAGAEFFAGIPGTFGGALAMNAGAFGGETWDVVTSVDTIDKSGTVRTRNRTEFDVGYRRVLVPAGEWFLSGEVRLEPEQRPGAGRDRIKEFLSRRADTQPLKQPNAGSVFRNPPGDHAARLIEMCGLKGERSGGASVSTVHANFIVNDGAAKARDIENLIERIRREVAEQQGVELYPEVRIVGDLQ